MIIRRLSLFMLGLWWLTSAPAAGPVQFYKWVDEQGRVHYSDTVPPAAAGQEREVKSASGQTVQVIEPPPTRQQLQASQRAHEQAMQAERRRQAQEEYDQTLLLTFSDVQEITAARDDRLRAVSAQIELIQKRLDKLQARLQEQQRAAMHIERTGRGDPTPIYTEIAQIQKNIAANNTFIGRKLKKQQRIRQHFALATARYRELMAARVQQAHKPLNKP